MRDIEWNMETIKDCIKEIVGRIDDLGLGWRRLLRKVRDDNSPNLNVRQQSDLVDGDRTKYVMDWPYMIILRHDGLLHEIIEGRMRGKPTTGSRRIQMRHDLANDGGSV